MHDLLTIQVIPPGLAPGELLALVIIAVAILVPLDVLGRVGVARLRGRPRREPSVAWMLTASGVRALAYLAALATWPLGIAILVSIAIGVGAHLFAGVLNGLIHRDP